MLDRAAPTKKDRGENPPTHPAQGIIQPLLHVSTLIDDSKLAEARRALSELAKAYPAIITDTPEKIASMSAQELSWLVNWGVRDAHEKMDRPALLSTYISDASLVPTPYREGTRVRPPRANPDTPPSLFFGRSSQLCQSAAIATAALPSHKRRDPNVTVDLEALAAEGWSSAHVGRFPSDQRSPEICLVGADAVSLTIHRGHSFAVRLSVRKREFPSSVLPNDASSHTNNCTIDLYISNLTQGTLHHFEQYDRFGSRLKGLSISNQIARVAFAPLGKTLPTVGFLRSFEGGVFFIRVLEDVKLANVASQIAREHLADFAEKGRILEAPNLWHYILPLDDTCSQQPKRKK